MRWFPDDSEEEQEKHHERHQDHEIHEVLEEVRELRREVADLRAMLVTTDQSIADLQTRVAALEGVGQAPGPAVTGQIVLRQAR